MILREFMETDIFKNAVNIKYIGVDGWNLDYDDIFIDSSVINYSDVDGYLEIQLNVI